MANGNGNRNLPKVPTFTDKFRLPGFGGFGGGGLPGGGGGYGPGSNFMPQGFGNFSLPNLPETPGGAYVPPGGAEPPAQPPSTGGVFKSGDDEDEGELAEIAPGGVDDEAGEGGEEFPSEPWPGPGGPTTTDEDGDPQEMVPDDTIGDDEDDIPGDVRDADTDTRGGEDDGGEEEDLAASGEGEDDPNAGVDEKFQGLLDDWEESWSAEGGTQSEILGQSAAAHRRIAEINADLGRSVGGGFGGAYNEVTINTINELAKAKAKHAEGRRDLLLNWMEKSIDQDFSREMAAGEQAMAMVTALLQSGEPIDEDTMDWLMGIAGGGMDWRQPDVSEAGTWTGSWEDFEGASGERGVYTGGLEGDDGTDSDNDGYSDAYERSINTDPNNAESSPSGREDAPMMHNDAGDWYWGVDEDGNWAHGQNAGVVTDDPHNEDSGEHQWFMVKQNASEFSEKTIGDLTFTGPDFYYEDENGNRVNFRPGVDGGRWPGDKSYHYREEYTTGYYTGEPEESGSGQEWSESYYTSPNSDMELSTLGMREQIMEILPLLFGADSKGEAHEPFSDFLSWETLGLDPSEGDDSYDGVMGATFSSPEAAEHYKDLMNSPGLRSELAAFTLNYMEEYEGTKPSPEALRDHLRETRFWIGNV